MIAIIEILGNPLWTEKLKVTGKKYQDTADTVKNFNDAIPGKLSTFEKLKYMGDRANALAKRNEDTITARRVDADPHKFTAGSRLTYKEATGKLYPNRGEDARKLESAKSILPKALR